MDPRQPSPYQTTPPPTPAPQPEAFPLYGSPSPQYSQQPSGSPYPPQPQTQAQPQTQPQPQAPASYHSSIGTAPTQSVPPSPNSWYTPPQNPNANKPSDVSTYLQASGAAPSAPGAAGQTVNGQYSIDYLDQLAGPTSQGVDKKFVIIGITGVLALIVAAFLLFATPSSSPSTKSEVALYTTMVDVEATTSQSKRHIKNSQLAAINSNLRTSLVNATRDMTDPLTGMGQDPVNLKVAAKKPPYHDDKLVATLEDARLNGIYDRVYANEINNKVLFILTYMESIEKNNSRESMQAFLKNNQPNFTELKESIEEYRDSPSANLY